MAYFSKNSVFTYASTIDRVKLSREKHFEAIEKRIFKKVLSPLSNQSFYFKMTISENLKEEVKANPFLLQNKRSSNFEKDNKELKYETETSHPFFFESLKKWFRRMQKEIEHLLWEISKLRYRVSGFAQGIYHLLGIGKKMLFLSTLRFFV